MIDIKEECDSSASSMDPFPTAVVHVDEDAANDLLEACRSASPTTPASSSLSAQQEGSVNARSA